MRLHKKRRTLKQKIQLKCFYGICIIIVCCTVVFIQYDRNVLPVAIEISEKYATTKVNEEISKAVEGVVSEKELKSSDFYTNAVNTEGRINYMSVDTLLINQICGKVASDVSKGLNEMSGNKMKLPVGVFSGINLLSHYGPKCTVRVSPIGDAVVDYETNFEAVGINQVSFQVWLKVETDVSIANPMYDRSMKISRRLMLVDTVFNGEVPEAYLDINRK